MPARQDIETILMVGSGPIVIGQASEFDYAGTQACKALRQEGYRVVLVNSNPATIMTDPSSADAVYIEPLNWQTVAQVIERERPQALLPTMGGQTGLNCALDLARNGVLAQYGVELIGANQESIAMAEERDRFRRAMGEIGLATPRAAIAHSLNEALAVQAEFGFPVIVRPSYTLGGSGGGIAYNHEEFRDIIERGLDLSPTREVLLEASVLGWKEFELEVVRDAKDNCIIVCTIENLDPMGIHTGDSITVAPAQTLTDKEYQVLRDSAVACLRKIGVDTGGSNVQFAVHPATGEVVVIEMNPRVSRSSALASKATGFPIAKVAARLAVGYTLDELRNEITGGVTPASFEPSIDYIVTKIPRFAFEKFPQADDRLTTQMKSVGEVMGIGRSFAESLQKAMRSLETGQQGFDPVVPSGLSEEEARATLKRELQQAGPHRLWFIGEALRRGVTPEQVHAWTGIDPWFVGEIARILEAESQLAGVGVAALDAAMLTRLKRMGFSDQRLARLLGVREQAVRERRHALGVRPVYKRVDSCAAEFPATTAYMYSVYETACEAAPTDRRKIMVLGGGPNRIGQGIEFDYCCVHAAMALREDGFETIMVNCNPETVSTDYDISDRLYFEPLTLEDVLEIVHVERPEGVIVQYGGQTPLKLARDLEAMGVPIVGTSPASIDLAEDRERFQQTINRLGLLQPANQVARTEAEALELAAVVGYPLVVRPSYVLGGRAMEIVYAQEELARYMREAVAVSEDSPVLLDRFLDDAIEVDVDAVSDGRRVVIGGIMEHIEQAGVHSGDSACSLPPYGLSEPMQARIRDQVGQLARALSVVGLMNVQFAVKGEELYVLEVNPRASRTVPFVAKASGLALAKVGARCMSGRSLDAQGIHAPKRGQFFAVKEAVLPFIKFAGVDPLLGPEMKSTGEVMGVGRCFGAAYVKALQAVGIDLPRSGTVLVSVRDQDKEAAVAIARDLVGRGFEIVATRGTAEHLQRAGVACRAVNKVIEGRPHIVDMIKNKELALIVNTTEGRQAIADSYMIRREALQSRVTYTTTMAGARAIGQAYDFLDLVAVHSLTDLHRETTHG